MISEISLSLRGLVFGLGMIVEPSIENDGATGLSSSKFSGTNSTISMTNKGSFVFSTFGPSG